MRFIIIKILNILSKKILVEYKPVVIGIAGSVGKSSAREAVCKVLRNKYKIAYNKNCYRTDLGIPLAIIGAESGGTSSRAQTGSSSLQGMKTIVIDPGHGGLEPGARGRFGTLEKNVALEIGLKLRSVIERNFPSRVVLTRDKDLNVSLENRAALANNNKADFFISIHANSSFRKDAHGSETYFLSRDATDEEARKLAFLENNPTEFGEGITGESEDEIQMILWDMAQSAYLKQSSLLAESIQKELNLLLRTSNRGIKQAPFTVLAGVACPAVLVEVAFISNPREERSLTREGFQINVAQAIYRGLVNYIELYSQK